jgi:RHS repeat-associated protein
MMSAWTNQSRFTGKERDSETGLDYFGARYYGSTMGRWLSPDWSSRPEPIPYANLDNPQSLNLYGYVLNNPLAKFDPDGHIDCTGKNAEGVGCQYIAQWNAAHGITPTAKKSDAPGVPVRLPNGKTVADNHSPTGVLMSPTADLGDVAAAGKAINKMIQEIIKHGADGAELLAYLRAALKDAVAQNGDFDYQRATFVKGDLQQLPQFRDVSNFNVGLIGQQAGLSQGELLKIVGYYASKHSLNYKPDQPYGLDPRTMELTVAGYQAGASGVYGQ